MVLAYVPMTSRGVAMMLASLCKRSRHCLQTRKAYHGDKRICPMCWSSPIQLPSNSTQRPPECLPESRTKTENQACVKGATPLLWSSKLCPSLDNSEEPWFNTCHWICIQHCTSVEVMGVKNVIRCGFQTMIKGGEVAEQNTTNQLQEFEPTNCRHLIK